MKILVITVFPPHWAPEAVHGLLLCEHLADHGLEVHAVTQKGGAAPDHPKITVHPIMRNWSWSELPRLALVMKRCSPDAIILVFVDWIYWPSPMITFLPTISKVLLPRVPFVSQFDIASALCMRLRRSFLTRLVRKVVKYWAGPADVNYHFGTLLRDSDRLIVLCNHDLNELASMSPRVGGKTVLIPVPPLLRMSPDNNGASRQRGREILGVGAKTFVLVFFGYVFPGKGVETLLKAFRLASDRRSGLRLVIVGEVLDPDRLNQVGGIPPDQWFYSREICDLLRQLHIVEKVTWTGKFSLENDEASLYLRAADLCVLPFDCGVRLYHSSFAGAASHGLPIITTRGAQLEWPFVHEENVFLCPVKDPDALAAAIETLAASPDLRSRLGAGALKLADECFSWEKVVERTLITFT